MSKANLVETNSGKLWRSKLEKWAIPQSILDQAPENPWTHPAELFQIPLNISDSISHQRAREVVPVGGTLLDVGCGGGIAAFAVTPPAAHVIGVDHQPEMLAMFNENARARGITSEIFEGLWPEIGDLVPIADVVTAHHVVYNVPQIEEFLIALNGHASSRVVLEMPQRHPLANASELWKHFWNIERPKDPTPNELMEVLSDLEFEAHLELWDGSMRRESDLSQLAHYSRIRLCLSADREDEVLEFLASQPQDQVRNLATIWWDIA